MTNTNRSGIPIRRRLRIIAGRWRFEAVRLVADNAAPLARKIARVDEPIADRQLLVVAHPRSGSTLIAHILNDHPEITGHGEHHVSYRSADDLEALAARTAFHAHDLRLRVRYVMDKIVLQQHEIGPAVAAAPGVRFVFLVREPVGTLESYRKMFADLPTDADRFRMYRRRLTSLVELARRIDDPDRAFVITYDELVSNPGPTLAALTDWLELSEPLRQEYELTAKTGRQSWGDPSDTIKSGRIVRRELPDVALDPDVAEAADRVHASTVRTLRSLCATTPSPPSDRDRPISELPVAP